MRIFLRSFLSFWVATVLIVLASMCTIGLSGDQGPIAAMSLPVSQFQTCAEDSLLQLYSKRIDQGTVKITVAKCGLAYILNQSGANIFGGAVPKEIASLALLVTPERPISFGAVRRQAVLALDVSYDSHFVAVAILPGSLARQPPLLGWQLLSAIVLSTLVCLVLTRSVVNPIRRLQACTEAFGRGELASRPAAELLRRRDEIGDLSNSVWQMSSRISTLLSSQKNFLIQVSHELGSPLTRLNIALKLARRKASGLYISEFDRIQQESSELNSMIQQLLLLARLESGLERDHQDTYTLDELMREVCDDARFAASEAAKDVHFLSRADIVMCGYRELLKRALDNVLRNAIRFAPEGTCVDVEVFTISSDMIAIHVKDHGLGVRADKLDAIFDPFVREAPAADRSGAGLGLAIARQAVHANGGTICARNLPDGGLQIEINLPTTINQNERVETATAGAESLQERS